MSYFGLNKTDWLLVIQKINIHPSQITPLLPKRKGKKNIHPSQNFLPPQRKKTQPNTKNYKKQPVFYFPDLFNHHAFSRLRASPASFSPMATESSRSITTTSAADLAAWLWSFGCRMMEVFNVLWMKKPLLGIYIYIHTCIPIRKIKCIYLTRTKCMYTQINTSNVTHSSKL